MNTERKQQLSTSGGFTLIELMIAVLIVTAGLVTILGSMLSMNAQQRYADQEAMSSIYMTYLLEDLQENVTQSGNINNVTGYDGPYGVLFVAEDSEVNVFIEGLGHTRLRMIQGAAGATADTVEVQIQMLVRDPKSRWVGYTASKLIVY